MDYAWSCFKGAISKLWPSEPEEKTTVASIVHDFLEYRFDRSGLKIFSYRYDVTQLTIVDCIVCPANGVPNDCHGVTKDVLKYADKTMLDSIEDVECKNFATTQAVTLHATGDLKCLYVIFVCVPDKRRDTRTGGYSSLVSDLTLCIKNCLREASKENIKRLAFPALASGNYGIQKCDAAEAMIDALISLSDDAKGLQEVHIVDQDGEFNKHVREKLQFCVHEKPNAGLMKQSDLSSPVDRICVTQKNYHSTDDGDFEVVSETQTNASSLDYQEETSTGRTRQGTKAAIETNPRKEKKRLTQLSSGPAKFPANEVAFHMFTRSQLKVFTYVSNITQLDGVEGLVCQCNANLDHLQGVAFDISNIAGFPFKQQCCDYINVNKSLPVTDVFVSAAGGSLQNKSILHACVPNMEDYLGNHTRASQRGGYTTFLSDLKLTVLNCLREAKRKGILNLALPAIGSELNNTMDKSDIGEVLIDALISLADDSGSLREIHIVDLDPQVIQSIRERLDFSVYEIAKSGLERCDSP